MKNWYVAYTHAKSETKALYHLQRQGFNTYLPRYHKQRRHARRIDHVLAPFFPRYIFVQIDISRTPWRAINSTLGVIDLICHGGRPAPVPENVVEGLLDQENESGLIHLSKFQNFTKGESVQVMAGALCDQVGVFDCLDDNERVVILLDILGRKVKVRLSAEAIKAAA